VNIHFYQQFHTGPSSPGTLQSRKLVRLLAERGHHVDVVAGDFNASNEQAEPEETHVTEAGGGVRVYRLRTPRGMRESLRARLKTYTRFAWQAYRFAGRLERPHLVIGTIQPLFTGLAALWVARRHRVPFLLEVRDLWPDALEAKGAVTGW
jgi:hypothetical protein